MLAAIEKFDQVWLVDFEFQARSGERPVPICLVAREYPSGRTFRVWLDDPDARAHPPYPVYGRVLLVAFYASAEIGCLLAMGWPVPPYVLDLYTEFRNHTNGKPTPCGWGLLGALAYFGLDCIETAEKEGMRALAMRGGPYTADERLALLDYCESDVVALARLLPKMVASIDLPRALLRGRYMVAAARMEHLGVPLDAPLLSRLREQWDPIKTDIIDAIDRDYGVFDGTTFKRDRFTNWLAEQGIPWPRLESGALALDDDTFRELAKSYPQVAPLRELRYSLSQMRLSDLEVGADGRNRCMLSAFRSSTGRNQPSNTKFIFGPSVWLRGLIRPAPGHGVAYIDWSQQEFGIAAALSGDPAMGQAYLSGDPYMEFARQAGAVPSGATKRTHGAVRDQFKACVLGVQYAMGSESLALRIAQPPARARELLEMHRRTYPRFWRWSDAAVDLAMFGGRLWTVFGWTIYVGLNVNPRSLRNFPMQANGAEMLRLACCLATERGIRVCAPVHDALLIEFDLERRDEVIRATQDAMAEASRCVLDGFELRSDAEVYCYPQRYSDKRGQRMWETVMRALDQTSTPIIAGVAS